MIAKISSDGTLIIKPENGLEAYALKKWCDDNRLRIGGKIILQTELKENEDAPD